MESTHLRTGNTPVTVHRSASIRRIVPIASTAATGVNASRTTAAVSNERRMVILLAAQMIVPGVNSPLSKPYQLGLEKPIRRDKKRRFKIRNELKQMTTNLFVPLIRQHRPQLVHRVCSDGGTLSLSVQNPA
jgi:hypothetical protein